MLHERNIWRATKVRVPLLVDELNRAALVVQMADLAKLDGGKAREKRLNEHLQVMLWLVDAQGIFAQKHGIGCDVLGAGKRSYAVYLDCRTPVIQEYLNSRTVRTVV
jgi:hypothetical protein